MITNCVKECPDCGGSKIKTIDSRMSKNGMVRRRRVCSECSYRWSTVEMEVSLLKVAEPYRFSNLAYHSKSTLDGLEYRDMIVVYSETHIRLMAGIDLERPLVLVKLPIDNLETRTLLSILKLYNFDKKYSFIGDELRSYELNTIEPVEED